MCGEPSFPCVVVVSFKPLVKLRLPASHCLPYHALPCPSAGAWSGCLRCTPTTLATRWSSMERTTGWVEGSAVVAAA